MTDSGQKKTHIQNACDCKHWESGVYPDGGFRLHFFPYMEALHIFSVTALPLLFIEITWVCYGLFAL